MTDSFKYKQAPNKIARHYLYPAMVIVSAKPAVITSVLGSCVSVCLWDRKLKQGGINHYMLPYWNGDGLASPKYGNIAIDHLIQGMIKIGSRKENLIAKIFGGARILNVEHPIFNIGERNIEFCFTTLKKHNIRIVSQSVGGSHGRKIIYFTNTGEIRQKVLSRKIATISNDD